MSRLRPSEVEVGRVVRAWLADLRWEVYQEVELRGGVADLVVTRGPLLGVIELKVSPGLRLLEQARGWREVAHYVWVAHPPGKHGFFHELCGESGIGALVVGGVDSDYYTPRVTERIAPELRRTARVSTLRERLREEHKTSAEAGSVGGGRFTPFAATCRDLLNAARANPGLTLRELIRSVRHHYLSPASARSALAKWISSGVVEGVELRDGKVYPR